ncbi:hypothetical protein [Hydromonas duriensis]|uniref:Uncharacterized protein n=1 Tax=Hydromonas duriensis TaxID=1527608 RepID=A0A4R6Y4K4_9BURK|nr:hypothetical protein [Hydromonas duriensis]TDR28950.1 hypothetical protein DFR44_13019 [Hydromonas duriensis]
MDQKNLDIITNWVVLQDSMAQIKDSLATVFKGFKAFPKLKGVFAEYVELASIINVLPAQSSDEMPKNTTIEELALLNEHLLRITKHLKVGFLRYKSLEQYSEQELEITKQLTNDVVDIEVCKQCFERFKVAELIN